MPQWISFIGLNREGKKYTGVLAAENKNAARAYLRQQGILVKKCGNQGLISSLHARKIRKKYLLPFYKQLAILTKANLSIAKALNLMSKEQAEKSMHALIQQLKNDVESGLAFSFALKKHPHYFGSNIPELVDAAERIGRLPEMLASIAKTEERQQKLRQNIQKALRYPIIVSLTAIFILYGLLTFIIPQFQTLFASMHAKLPTLSQAIITTFVFLQAKSVFIAFFLILAFSVLFFLKRRFAYIAFFFDKAICTCPVIGTIIKKLAIARFASSLSLSLSAGLPLIEALKIGASVHTNRFFSQGISFVLQTVANGQRLHQAMRHTALFPPLVTELIAVGEETGNLTQSFLTIATDYENNLDEQVTVIPQLLEPIMLLVLGLFIGLIIIALYLPIFTLGTLL